MKWFRIITILLLLLALLLFVLPNILNWDERAAFDDNARIQQAQHQYLISELGDSITIAPGPYYSSSSSFYTFLMGKEYRDLWKQPVTMPVFHLNTLKGGLRCSKVGGGDQTTSLTLFDSTGCAYTLRSVNKDQSGALSSFWQASILRPMMRDQVAALMPWGIMSLKPLYDAVGIIGTEPQYYFVPFDPAMDSACRNAMAGKVAILEIEPEDNRNCRGWPGPGMMSMNTKKMMAYHLKDSIPVDAACFAKCRLLDIVIGDWDRHAGNWAWNLITTDSGRIIRPIPIDRDMVFFKMEGLLPGITRKVQPKFQSFTPEISYLEGYTINSKSVDQDFLMEMDSAAWIQIAREMQSELTDPLLMSAVLRLPKEVPQKVSRQFFYTLQARRDQLPEIAREFYAILHN